MSLGKQNVGKVAVGLGVFRVERYGFTQLGNPLIVGVSECEDNSIVMMSLGIQGVKGDRPLEVMLSFCIVAISRQYVSEVVVCLRIVGPGFGLHFETALRPPLPRPSGPPPNREDSAPQTARD